MTILWAILIVVGILILYAAIYSIAYKRATKGIDLDIDLGAPMKNLHEVIAGDGRDEYKRMYRFIKGDYSPSKDINERWMQHFISVCHWAGYRIVLYKGDKQNIESSSSVVLDEELLDEFSKSNYIFDEKKFEAFKDKKTRREKELKQIKKKLKY